MVTYCDIQGGYGGTGNIDADPFFVNPSASDYHLQPGSPCIDIGDNAAPSLPTTDFEGDPRILGGIVDMGVDEATPKTDTTTTTKLTVNKKTCLGKPPVITLGQSVQDTATVTGANKAATAGPSGNVQFQWSNDNGNSWTTFSNKVLTAKNNYIATATSDSFAPSAAGGYLFRATYSGDIKYYVSQSADNAEPLKVNKASTVAMTRLSNKIIKLSESVTDTININTIAKGTLPVASGTWTVLASKDLFFRKGVVTLDSGVVSSLPFKVTTKSFTPTSAGIWYFKVTYSGDSNYDKCQSFVEILIVK